jgi:hypothetical protein
MIIFIDTDTKSKYVRFNTEEPIEAFKYAVETINEFMDEAITKVYKKPQSLGEIGNKKIPKNS